MRHSPLTFAAQIKELSEQGVQWDLIFASSMLHLAEMISFLPSELAQLPCVYYFHENQLTYPDPNWQEHDLQLAFSQFSSALCADAVWFNSEFHRTSFLNALNDWLSRMPDFQLQEERKQLTEKCQVEYMGVQAPADISTVESGSKSGAPHILWAARWEQDKNPESFFAALQKIKQQEIPFQLSVIGESFQQVPACFSTAKAAFHDEIVHWGFQKDREEYWAVLQECDIYVSTAEHEFFGISTVEAVLAGCYPLLPHRLAYPELLNCEKHPKLKKHFYQTDMELTQKLSEILNTEQASLQRKQQTSCEIVSRFLWSKRQPALDAALVDTLCKQ